MTLDIGAFGALFFIALFLILKLWLRPRMGEWLNKDFKPRDED
jgi:hypothetical protein